MVTWLARYKPKQVAKAGLVRPLTQELVQLVAEAEPDDYEPDSGDDTASKLAAQVFQSSQYKFVV